MWTVNDSTFNEMLRGVYSGAADKLLEGTDIMEKIAEKLGLEYEVPSDEEGRF